MSVLLSRVLRKLLCGCAPIALLNDTRRWCCAVAAALKDWGLDHGATCTAHWFQPLGSNEVRPGMAGMVINHFFAFHPEKGNIEFKYDGETLIKGETDGSSYPNGGLRATHTAGGYTSECVLHGSTCVNVARSVAGVLAVTIRFNLTTRFPRSHRSDLSYLHAWRYYPRALRLHLVDRSRS